MHEFAFLYNQWPAAHIRAPTCPLLLVKVERNGRVKRDAPTCSGTHAVGSQCSEDQLLGVATA
ncbi:MAG: hypothetical protein O6950_09480 [Gammaproteobacteria bacterium]|nr:hypothetical protein [Gammaproteobacteria bacterium]